MQRRSTRLSAGVVGLALVGTLTLGTGAALAQEGDELYPASPAATEQDPETDVLPEATEQVADPAPDPAEPAPDPAVVQANVLSATGADTLTWVAVGLGIIVLGGGIVVTTRRRTHRAP